MSNQYIIIRDCCAGNGEVGEMWQETKIFDGSATLDEVMVWGMDSAISRDKYHSRKRITITKPHANRRE